MIWGAKVEQKPEFFSVKQDQIHKKSQTDFDSGPGHPRLFFYGFLKNYLLFLQTISNHHPKQTQTTISNYLKPPSNHLKPPPTHAPTLFSRPVF